MRGQNLFYCYLTILVLESLSYGYAIRMKKAIPGDHRITPSEISKECCFHGWYSCCGYRNREFETCGKNVTDTVEQSTKCIYNKEEKTEARNLYCVNLVLLNNNLVNDVIPKINAYAKCAKSRNPDLESYRTKEQIQNAVHTWHESFISTYTDRSRTSCCGENVITGNEKIAQLDIPLPIPDCTMKWAEALNNFTATVAYINYVERLGRFKYSAKIKCIRGCVGMPSLECVRTLFESVIPPTSSTTSHGSSQQSGVTYQSAVTSESSSVHVQ